MGPWAIETDGKSRALATVRDLSHSHRRRRGFTSEDPHWALNRGVVRDPVGCMSCFLNLRLTEAQVALRLNLNHRALNARKGISCLVYRSYGFYGFEKL